MGVDYTKCTAQQVMRTESSRTAWMAEAAKQSGVGLISVTESKREERKLMVLPYYEYTSHLLHLHGTECTHYCHTPDLWIPILRGIRVAMERVLAWNQ